MDRVQPGMAEPAEQIAARFVLARAGRGAARAGAAGAARAAHAAHAVVGSVRVATYLPVFLSPLPPCPVK